MSELPALRRLQQLWLLMMVTLALVGIVIPQMEFTGGSLPIALPIGLAAAVSAAVVLTIMAMDRTFAATPPDNDRQALVRYKSRQAIQFALAQAPAIVGILLSTTFGTELAGAMGCVGALVALTMARPSVERLASIERSWQEQGLTVSALRAAANPRPLDGLDGPDRSDDIGS